MGVKVKPLEITLYLEINQDVEVNVRVIKTVNDPGIHPIIYAAANAMGLKAVDIVGKCRDRDLVVARKSCAMLLKMIDGLSASVIAKIFGKTIEFVAYTVKTHDNSMKHDKFYRESFMKISNAYLS